MVQNLHESDRASFSQVKTRRLSIILEVICLLKHSLQFVKILVHLTNLVLSTDSVVMLNREAFHLGVLHGDGGQLVLDD